MMHILVVAAVLSFGHLRFWFSHHVLPGRDGI